MLRDARGPAFDKTCNHGCQYSACPYCENARRKTESDHYKALYEREQNEHHYYKAQLLDAWKSLQQQQKGMRRMARKIQRQRAAIINQEIEMASLALELDRIKHPGLKIDIEALRK